VRCKPILMSVALIGLLTAGIITVPAAFGATTDQRTEQRQVIHLLDVKPLIISLIHEGGSPGLSTGDVEVFSDSLTRPDNPSIQVGTGDGQCTLIDPTTGRWECTITTGLPGGTITANGIGVLVPGATSVAAITGGTGEFNGARGEATLVFHPNGGPSVVTFELLS
jgi:hypothetical protein